MFHLCFQLHSFRLPVVFLATRPMPWGAPSSSRSLGRQMPHQPLDVPGLRAVSDPCLSFPFPFPFPCAILLFVPLKFVWPLPVRNHWSNLCFVFNFGDASSPSSRRPFQTLMKNFNWFGTRVPKAQTVVSRTKARGHAQAPRHGP